MQNQTLSEKMPTTLGDPEMPASESRSQEPKVNDPGVFCISAVVKIFDPGTQEIFLETRA